MTKSTKIKFPCGHCNKSSSGCAAILCNICEMWHHWGCVPGMTKESYEQLVTMKDTMGYSFFLCGKCDKVHMKVWSTVTNLGKKVDAMDERLKKVEKLLEDYEKKNTETAKKVEKVETRTVAAASEVKVTVVNELQEQENRKTNIVFYNLKESEAEEGIDRKNHDISEIASLLQQIELPVSVKDDIASIRRLGKIPPAQADAEPEAEPPQDAQLGVDANQPKPRPLLVSFKSPSSRKDILTNAKKLAKSPLAHVSVCPDLTKTQQTEDRKLREEVKKLNAENPTDDKGAFLWKVVGVAGQRSRRKVKVYAQTPPQ